jgi:hypothetical protein
LVCSDIGLISFENEVTGESFEPWIDYANTTYMRLLASFDKQG